MNIKISGCKTIQYKIILFLFLIISINSSAQNSEDPVRWKRALKQDPDWYSSKEAIRIADNLLVYQHKTGGWPKNINMTRLLNKEEIEEIKKLKNEKGTKLSRATMDNGATSSQLRYLARVFDKTGYERFKHSFLRGVNYLLEAQYDNGGWPQYYPIREGYYQHITYNDNAMVNTMRLLRDLHSDKEEFGSLQISTELKEKVKKSFDKGIQCILHTQIIFNGKPAVWCAQHDENTLAPVKARSYELESFSGSESVGIVLLLMSIDNPSEDIIASVNGAVQWFENNKIEGIKVERVINKEGKKDRIVVEDDNAPPLWGRFYDLETSKPFFCSRDGIKKASLAEISHNRRNGYGWYTKAPEKVFKEYPKWKEKINKD